MESEADLRNVLRSLFAAQRLAVLGTHDRGQPYSNLIAFVHTDNLKHLAFVTGRATRKYGNVLADGKVAVLVDDRKPDAVDFSDQVAVTALGTAAEARGPEKEEITQLYLAKHPSLKDFVNSRSSALVSIRVSEYIVARFDSVQRVAAPD